MDFKEVVLNSRGRSNIIVENLLSIAPSSNIGDRA